MSGYVIEIPQEKENGSIWSQQLRVAAYCRVSTPYEEQQKSLEKQIEYFTRYIKRNPFWRFVAVYADNASGLHTKNRPGYQKMLKDCRKGKIDLILVKSLSRFGRDAKETMTTIRRLKQMGIGVYIELGGINTLTSPDSIVDLYATFNQAESQNKSDNIKFGLRQRMKSGKTMLNHSQFLGYTKGPDGVLQVVPEEAEIVQKIFDLYVQGNGVRKIKVFSQAVFNSLSKAYSEESLSEIKEELRALYDPAEIETIINCFMGYKTAFSVSQLKKRISTYYAGTVIDTHFNQVIEDLYRLGFLGNFMPISKIYRWQHKGDERVILANEWRLFVNYALH